jgi:hypothetical protein
MYDRLSTPLRVVVLFALVTVSACAPLLHAPVGGAGAPAPTAAVEQFMRYSEAQEYQAMGWLFGTERGSVMRRDRIADVEKRMYAIATVLRYDRYELAEVGPVAGRGQGARRFNMTLHNGARTTQVPIVVVRGPSDRWFVEQIGLEAITNPERQRR